MTRARLDVAVIGCGTAGPAVALFLAEAGHRVTLYERVPEPSPVGAGIILQPTGQHVLARLGLHDVVVPRGTRLDGLRIETHRGRTLAALDYAALSSALFGVGLHRGLLFQALFGAVKQAPIALRLGVAIEDLRRTADGLHILVDAEGNTHGPHALVIVADGARSHLRDDTDPSPQRAELDVLPKRVRQYPWGALWFVGDDAKGAYGHELRQVVRGTHRMVGVLPTGRGPRTVMEGHAPDSAQDPLRVSLFYSVRCDRAEETKADVDAWKREVRALMPAAGPVLDQIHASSDLLFAAYHDVQMPRWHTRDVVYIGDAAHAMSPQLGQGCNLALVDAMVLADCLAAHDSVPAALAAYSRERQPHLRFYQFATRWLTPFFQSDFASLGWLRDRFMGLASRIPFMRRQMIASMCGVKRGIVFGGSLPLPPPKPALPSATTA